MNNDAVKKAAVEDMKPILILGGTGKTGRRVAERLTARGLPIRIGSRSGEPSFDWEKQSTWESSLRNVEAVYITYYPLTDLFTKVLDGRNSHLTDGVQRALGREPRGFADYARDAATTGVWGGSR